VQRLAGLAVLGVLLVASGLPAAASDSWPQPRVSVYTADWQAAQAALPISPLSGSAADPWSAANALAREHFPAIARSPVPVLLPYAIGDDAHDRATDNVNPVTSYLSGFEPTRFFHAGPTGYDAGFILRPADIPGLSDIDYKNPIVVQISAFNLLYELPEPRGAVVLPAGDIARDFPGIRRQILEHTLRYTFERFGIPYAVSIQCYDGPQRRTRLSCRNADRIALRFLSALRVVGGNRIAAEPTPAPAPVARPEIQSEVFRYHPPGKLVAGTGMRASSGNSDRTVYARLRFPAAAAPAYIQTQAFRRRTGPVVASSPTSPDDGQRSEARPFIWRDNFCERRDFAVGQCPSGRGHQGQDIRGVSCEPGPRKRDCPANQDVVVAARDGMILRESWHDSFFLVVNANGERLRLRHLHMHPRRLDDDGIFSGLIVTEGQRLGTIGNYNRRPGLTTTHLHFEMQVPTRDGYVRVNPYMTLVAAYEHLIGARGQEEAPPATQTDEEASAAETAASPGGETPVPAAVIRTSAAKSVGAENTSRIKSHREKARGKAKRKSRGVGKISARARLAKASKRKSR